MSIEKCKKMENYLSSKKNKYKSNNNIYTNIKFRGGITMNKIKDILFKKNKFVALLLLFLLALTTVSAKNLIENYELRDTNAKLVSANLLSNTKIGWGIKREKDHKQPDLGKVNIELINKYDGISIGNNESKKIYITFDQGYEAGYTEKILDVLKDNNVKATFFITAHYLNTSEELVKRMIDEGHIIGNHTPSNLMSGIK